MTTDNTRVLFSRNECFGKTVFDSRSFTHSYMSHPMYKEFSATQDIHEIRNFPDDSLPGILYSPIRTYYDLTSRCNLRCKTCVSCSGTGSCRDLTHEESLKVIKGISSDCIFEVRFSGGEPTAREKWYDIMAFAKDAGLTVSLNSNGIFGISTLRSLIRLRPNEITISLDGYKGTNDYIRGAGTYERAVHSIKELSTGGLRVTINTVITSLLTSSDIIELLALAEQYCADISFFHLRPFGRARRFNTFTSIMKDCATYTAK